MTKSSSSKREDRICCAICRKILDQPRHEYRDLKYPSDPPQHFCDNCIEVLLDEVVISDTQRVLNTTGGKR